MKFTNASRSREDIEDLEPKEVPTKSDVEGPKHVPMKSGGIDRSDFITS